MTIENCQRPLSQHPEIAERISWLQDNWKPVGQVIKLPNQLIDLIDQFGRRRENRNRRGVKSTCISNVLRMLGHVKSGVKRQVDGDKKLAHDAKRFLKSLQHHNSLDQTMVGARQFAGTVQKVGKSLASKKAVCVPAEFDCGYQDGIGCIRLHRVVSVHELIKVGRKLENCVGNSDEIGRSHHRRLREGSAEYWTLECDTVPLFLLCVDLCDERQLEEIGGYKSTLDMWDEDELNWTTHLSAEILRSVQYFLDIDASENDYFSCVGAFRSLHKHERIRDCHDININRQHHRVWSLGSELIIASSRESLNSDLPPSLVQWSRFKKEEDLRVFHQRYRILEVDTLDECHLESRWEKSAYHPGAMDLGDLVELMTQSRELCDLLRRNII